MDISSLLKTVLRWMTPDVIRAGLDGMEQAAAQTANPFDDMVVHFLQWIVRENSD